MGLPIFLSFESTSIQNLEKYSGPHKHTAMQNKTKKARCGGDSGVRQRQTDSSYTFPLLPFPATLPPPHHVQALHGGQSLSGW